MEEGDIRIVAVPPTPREPHTPETMAGDLCEWGVVITLDGMRVDPADYYAPAPGGK